MAFEDESKMSFAILCDCASGAWFRRGDSIVLQYVPDDRIEFPTASASEFAARGVEL
jgi:hypothetical protein